MSRIGVKPITIPSGVTVTVQTDKIVVSGSKGSLEVKLLPGIKVEVVENQVLVKRNNDSLQSKAFHGLIRNLIQNQIIGVTQGFKKTLKMVGTGYRVASKGQGISLSVGFSHPVEVVALEGTKISVEGNDTIHVEGIDKQKVGQLSADIRKIRPPEPYKGKGIRYIDEEVIRKAGKTASK
jgi:large subunit ribosomal protein L6